MIFCCFVIYVWIFDYFKNCFKIIFIKEIGYGKFEIYMVLCGIMIFMLWYIKC